MFKRNIFLGTIVSQLFLCATVLAATYYVSPLGDDSSVGTSEDKPFQVFADRYERGSLLITSNLAFSEWVQVFQGERMTAALLDRLTHHCHIFEINGESYRFKQSVGKSKNKKK